MLSVYTHQKIHMEYYAGVKSNWELIYTKLWKNFEKIMLKQKKPVTRLYKFVYRKYTESGKLMDTESRLLD